ncbi:MAG: ATP-binding protein [Parvularculaceae bacterium]
MSLLQTKGATSASVVRHRIVQMIKKWSAPALAMLVTFFLCSAFVVWAEGKMRPDQSYLLTNFQQSRLDTALAGVPDADTFIPAEQSTFKKKLPKDTNILVLRTAVSVTDPDLEYALYISRAQSKVYIYVNGQALALESPSVTKLGKGYLKGRLYIIPAQYLSSGSATIDIMVQNQGHHGRFYESYFGPLTALSVANNWRNMLVYDAPVFMSGTSLFVALFAIFFSLWSNRERGEFFILGLLTLFWTAHNFYYLIPIQGFPVTLQNLLFISSTFGMALSVAAYAVAVYGASHRWYYLLLSVGFGYTLLSFILELVEPHRGDRLYGELGIWIIAAAILTGSLVLLRSVAQKGISVAAAIALSVCLSAALWDIFSELILENVIAGNFVKTSIPYVPLATIIMATGLIFGMVHRSIDLQNAEAANAAVLADELAKREFELEESYVRTREQEKQAAVFGERQRIMRDMHDGIGGQLLGLQFKLRQQGMTMSDVSDELQTSLNDLRLIVDSIDVEVEDLLFALGAYRARIQPALTAAGVSLDWALEIDEDIGGFGPKDVLQIYRILQEAVTNALRHSNMTNLQIRLRLVQRILPDHDDDMKNHQCVELVIRDDGDSLKGQMPSHEGKGLANIRSRVAALQGDVEIGLNTDARYSGVSIAIVIPLPGEQRRLAET